MSTRDIRLEVVSEFTFHCSKDLHVASYQFSPLADQCMGWGGGKNKSAPLPAILHLVSENKKSITYVEM